MEYLNLSGLCILWTVICFGQLLTYDPATCIQCRESHVCNPPDCFCCRDKMPLETHNIPQMVFFSFDDAVTPQVSAYYKELFDPSRKNPNGCPISMTLFISDRNTVYGLVKEFYDKGMEIASHSVTHSHPNARTFVREARKQKENLSKKTGIPPEHIKGWRSPFLEPLGDTQPNVLKSLGYEYDATLTITPKSNTDMPITPFTLDYGWPYDCKIKPCPSQPHKGFWEVPVVSVKDYLNMYDCVYVDGCNNPPPSESLAYKFLWDNFQKYYKTNRAPMGINMHASWFYYPERKAAMDKFIKTLVQMDDVYIVSINQVIEWLKKPTPIHQLDSFQQWNCRGNTSSVSGLQRGRHTSNKPLVPKQVTNIQQQEASGDQRTTFAQQQQTSQNRQSTWTPRQRQQFLDRDMPSARPPLVPNLPMVRFWWQTPQMMSARNIEIQRNRQIQQAQQEAQRQEALRQQRAEEERRRRVEEQRKEEQARKEAEQRRLQELDKQRLAEQRRLQELERQKLEEQRRLQELEKKRLEEQRRQEVLRQQEQERKERQRLIELQKQKERERLRMEELKQKEMLKQQELQRQRQEMLAQQQLQRQREIQRKALEVTRNPHQPTSALMHKQKQLQKDIARQERPHSNIVDPISNNVNTESSSPVGSKLNNILRLKQNQRIQQLEQLSLSELKALQQELRDRLIRERTQKAGGSGLVEQVSLTDKHGRALEILGTNKEPTPFQGSGRAGFISENNLLNNNANRNIKLQLERNMVLREFHTAGGVTRTRINKNDTAIDATEHKVPSADVSTTTRPAIEVLTKQSTNGQISENSNSSSEGKTMWNVAELDTLDVPWKMWRTKAPNMPEKVVSGTMGKPDLSSKTPDRVTFLNVHTMKTSKPLFSKKTSHPTLFGSPLFASSKQLPEVAAGSNSRSGPSFTFKKTPVPIKVLNEENKTRVFTSSTENGGARSTIKPAPLLVVKATAETVPKSPTTTTTTTTSTTTTTTTTTLAPTTSTTTTTQSTTTTTTQKASTSTSAPSENKVNNNNRYVPQSTVQQSVMKVPKFGLAATPASMKNRGSYSSRRPSQLCQQGVNCNAPDCFCKTYTTPYDMKTADIPQMIYVTIDGALNFHTYTKVRSLFAPSRKNPNGCPVKGTVFVSDTGSSYSISNALQSTGIEIGMMGLRPRPYTNASMLASEIRVQRERMVRGSTITSEQIKGWRSPGFKPTGDEQFNVLSNQSLYDSSLISDRGAAGQAKLWPHTLDFGWSEHCEIEQCPNESHPGVWEVPVIPFVGPENSTQCEVTDGCPKQPKGEQQTFEYLLNNFNNYYKTNKAPFAIRLKQIWFHWYYQDNIKGLIKFLDTVLGYGDVYMTSIWDMIEWIKSPVPLKDISKFKPWQCSNTA